jgi:hypothetical protein
MVNGILDFLKLLVLTTASQLVWLLGLLFVFGLLLYLFARFTRITYVKSVGQKLDIVFTGWIGTPVHELGHAIFCILFRHKITAIRLYSPNAEDGTLGYVNHTYNPSSTYQSIGNFFIGIGPIIFGAIVLYAAFQFLVPNTGEVFANLELQSHGLVKVIRGKYANILEIIWSTTKATLKTLFNTQNLSNYKFWIFLYIAISVSSHMQLSPSDIKGAKSGLISLIIFFLVINLIILSLEITGISSHFGNWWNYVKIESYSSGINRWLGMSGALFVFATIISALNFIISYTALSIYNLIKGRGLINPIW